MKRVSLVLQVTVYHGANKVKQYEILEEVGDMAVVGNLLFTGRDTYVTVTEMLGKQCSSFNTPTYTLHISHKMLFRQNNDESG